MRTIFTFFICLFLGCSIALQGQIKVFNDNWISIGSLQKGGFGLQIEPNRYCYFQPSVYGEYSWSNLVCSTNDLQANWIVQNNENFTFFVYGNGYIYSRGIMLGSDRKFKENITDIDNPLGKILKLHGVSFNWLKSKTDTTKIDSVLSNDGKWIKVNTSNIEIIDSSVVNKPYLNELLQQRKMKHYGVIAQEVKEIVPELVNINPDGTYAVEYNAIIGILIEAIKEQQKQIDSLKNYYYPQSFLQNTGINNIKSVQDEASGNFLFQNKPNPFNKSTTIRYRTASNRNASILIFNLQGDLVKAIKSLAMGENEVVINGFELKPGMYLYTLVVEGTDIATRRMILTD